MFQAVQRAVGQMMLCGKGIPVFRGCLQGNPERGIVYQDEHLRPDVLMRKMDNHGRHVRLAVNSTVTCLYIK